MIDDVKLIDLNYHRDDRGSFGEIFRSEWLPDVDFSRVQINNSFNYEYTLRGLHYHVNQCDVWYVSQGLLQVVLVDLRKVNYDVEILFLDSSKILYIPLMVAHGFLALQNTDLIYLVNNFYDSKDEYGLAWDDKVLNINWAVSDPTISDRDKNNPSIIKVFEDLYSD